MGHSLVPAIVPPRLQLPRAARVLLVAAAAAAVAVAAPLLVRLRLHETRWRDAAIILVLAAAAELIPVDSRRGYSMKTTVTLVVAAALLLPPELAILVGLLPAAELVRLAWQKVVFNVAGLTLATAAACGAARLATGGAAPGSVRFVAGGLVVTVAFVVAANVPLGLMLRAADGRSLRAFAAGATWVPSELVLGTVGVVVASVWDSAPALVPVALLSLVPMRLAFRVPQLREDADRDAKTGLFNARRLAEELDRELERARRHDRPLALVMADLDFLRAVNNTYGHLAGDAAIAAVGRILREQTRPIDVAARFGGEEFCVLLPETTAEQAVEIAERLRWAVAEETVAPDGPAFVVTLSAGVAAYPADGGDAESLLRSADTALYGAKASGRNAVRRAAAAA